MLQIRSLFSGQPPASRGGRHLDLFIGPGLPRVVEIPTLGSTGLAILAFLLVVAAGSALRHPSPAVSELGDGRD